MAKKEVRRTPLNEGVNLLDVFDLMNQRESTGSLARIQSRRNINQPIDNTESLLVNALDQQNMLMPVSNEPDIGLLNTTQQQPNIANNVFGMPSNMQSQTMQQPFTINKENYQQPSTSTNTSGMTRNQRIGLMLAALSDAFAGRDIAGRALQRSQAFRQQAEIDRQRQQQIQRQETLKQYLNPQQYALYAAGVPFSDIAEFTTQDLSGQQIIEKTDESVEAFTKDTDFQDDYANLDQAFSPADAFQETVLNVPSRFLFGTDIASETAAAIRDRDNLNLEIMATLANDYTGRPSNFLLREIKKNIPESSATSEADAFQKYSNFEIQTESRIKNLEDGIKSPNVSDSNKEKYREELFKSKVLLKKLQAATLGLKGKSKNILEPDSNPSSEDYSNLYLE